MTGVQTCALPICFPGGQVTYELAARLDVSQRVLHAIGRRADSGGKHYGGRLITDRVEKTVRRKIEYTFFIDRTDPAYGSRYDKAVERIPGEAMVILVRFIKHGVNKWSDPVFLGLILPLFCRFQDVTQGRKIGRAHV